MADGRCAAPTSQHEHRHLTRRCTRTAQARHLGFTRLRSGSARTTMAPSFLTSATGTLRLNHNTCAAGCDAPCAPCIENTVFDDCRPST